MTQATTIPCLPCVSMAESLDFYRALGFEVTYQQKSPNEYAVVRQGGCEVHLFGLKGLKPEDGYTTCCVVVPDVEPLHRAFSEALRQKYGKLPIAGFPRITRFKPGQTRFTLTDPSGNSVICVNRSAHEGGGKAGQPDRAGEGDRHRGQAPGRERATTSRPRRCSTWPSPGIADAPALDRARAWPPAPNWRSRSARRRSSAAVRAELQRIPLSDEDREKYRHEFEAAEALEGGLR